MIKIIFHFSGSGAAQRKEKTTLPDDPVTITFVQTNAGSTFRYWQLFLHQILTTLQAGLAFFCYITHEGFFSVTFTLCYMVLCLSMANLVLTYLYSTDTFIFVFMVFVSLFLHRQYPHQVHDTYKIDIHIISPVQMTVSKASLVRNLPSASASGRVSASARADREGFIPPSRDWTTSPLSTPTSETSDTP